MIFTAVALFEFLGISMLIIPNALNELRRLKVSIQRIGRFLAVKDSFTSNTGVASGAGQATIGGAGASV